LGNGDDWVVDRTFDALDRVVRDVQDGREVKNFWTEESKRTGLAYPSTGQQPRVEFTHDALDRVSVIRADGPQLASYAYAGPDRLYSRSLRNRTITRWHDGSGNDSLYYDGAKRMLRVDHRNIVTGVELARFEHAYNRESSRLWEKRAHAGNATDTYLPDSLYRLTDVQRTLVQIGGGATSEHRTWQLDGVHNWEQFTVGAAVTDPAVNPVNEYTSFGAGVTPVHDLDGNMTSPDGPVTTDGAVLKYDFLNRLRVIEEWSGGVLVSSVEHDYDAEGRRARTERWNVPDEPTSTEYVHDGWEVIEEVDPATGALQRRFVTGIGVDEPICVENLSGRPGLGTWYYLQSTLGHVVALTDSTGAVVERYTYDAYGTPRLEDAASQPKAVSRSDFGNPYLFTGRRWEPWIVNLYEFRHRMYFPEQGRFAQRDPIGPWGDWLQLGSACSYVGGMPLDGFDPLGLNFTPLGKAFAFGNRIDYWSYYSWGVIAVGIDETLCGLPFLGFEKYYGHFESGMDYDAESDTTGFGGGVRDTQELIEDTWWLGLLRLKRKAVSSVVGAAEDVSSWGLGRVRRLLGAGADAARGGGAVGGKITGYTKHGLDQAIGRDGGRGVHPEAILDAVVSPTAVVEQAGGTTKYVGKNATVILNGEGKVVTTWGQARNQVPSQ
jgi:RHS repeat-associated protein